ncbi:hypothetical protein CDL15_Pgr018875 [Punica granatum]|uniref:Uncharacterized protein n=1 Tax=Punica granatum TaxID=22663 RepID=A0A218VVF2_PUNGR|nr:hypothetical protein CDL15_Pgr018875 [Punica granatum]
MSCMVLKDKLDEFGYAESKRMWYIPLGSSLEDGLREMNTPEVAGIENDTDDDHTDIEVYEGVSDEDDNELIARRKKRMEFQNKVAAMRKSMALKRKKKIKEAAKENPNIAYQETNAKMAVKIGKKKYKHFNANCDVINITLEEDMILQVHINLKRWYNSQQLTKKKNKKQIHAPGETTLFYLQLKGGGKKEENNGGAKEENRGGKDIRDKKENREGLA